MLVDIDPVGKFGVHRLRGRFGAKRFIYTFHDLIALFAIFGLKNPKSVFFSSLAFPSALTLGT